MCLRAMLQTIVCLLILLPSCASRRNSPSPSPTSGSSSISLSSALFADVTARSGIQFHQNNGATGKFYYTELMTGGCAFFDYDNDGYLDVLLIQSGSSEPTATVTNRPHCALYHNNHNGTFTDVTAGSGLDHDLGYGMGVAVGDYDNDGYDDLFLTSYGGNHLLHNEHGTGKFTDVTRKMGLDRVHSMGYATSATFGDYDNDGKLDLYVCYYVPWDWKHNKSCKTPSGELDYCNPDIYENETHQLFHNEGNRFRDVSQSSGIKKAQGRGLAVAFFDYDEDGRQDIFVANDLSENMLWHNQGAGKFDNTALQAGVARDESGLRMAAMGIAIADYDHSGRESLFVTNFSNHLNGLFKNMGKGLFTDVSAASGVGPPHMRYLSFGCEFFDYDADGWPDLITANGHVTTHIQAQYPDVAYREPNQLLHNQGDGTFREVTDTAALGDLTQPNVARGLAVGDYDNDGRLDILIVRQNDAPLLLHNQDHSANHWVSFKTVGTKSNRDGIHTRFILNAGGVRQTATVRGGSSYLSVSDRRVYFGLGKVQKIDSVRISWPSGLRQELQDLAVDRAYVVTEGQGIMSR